MDLKTWAPLASGGLALQETFQDFHPGFFQKLFPRLLQEYLLGFSVLFQKFHASFFRSSFRVFWDFFRNSFRNYFGISLRDSTGNFLLNFSVNSFKDFFNSCTPPENSYGILSKSSSGIPRRTFYCISFWIPPRTLPRIPLETPSRFLSETTLRLQELLPGFAWDFLSVFLEDFLPEFLQILLNSSGTTFCSPKFS